MDKGDIIFGFLLLAFACLIVFMGTSDYYKQKLSAKENEFTTAVRRAAYNHTKLCLDDGIFYDVTIYRMDGNREFYTVKPVK